MVLSITRFSFAHSQFYLKLSLPFSKGEVYISGEVMTIKLWLTQGKKVTWQNFKYTHWIRNTIYHQSQKNTSFSKLSLWFHKLLPLPEMQEVIKEDMVLNAIMDPRGAQMGQMITALNSLLWKWAYLNRNFPSKLNNEVTAPETA